MERVRIDNIEIRSTGTNDKFEIVRWCKSKDREYCYVLAWITPDGEDGIDITSVGVRPWELDEEELKVYNEIIKLYIKMNGYGGA